jgi:hypothetical protein
MTEFEYFIVTNGQSKTKYMTNNNVEELDLFEISQSKFLDFYNFRIYYQNVLTKDVDIESTNNPNSQYTYKTDSLYSLVKDYLFTATYEFYDYENLSKGITYQIFMENRIKSLLTHLYIFRRDLINNEFTLVKDSELTRTLRSVLSDNKNEELNIMIKPSQYEGYELIMKSIKDAMGRFNKATLHIDDTSYNVTKTDEGKFWIGNKPNQNQEFKKIFEHQLQKLNLLPYTLRVTTDSKYDDKMFFSELYGFRLELVKLDENDFDFTLNYINVDDLKYASLEADRKHKTSQSDYTVFCSLNGEKVLL